MSSWKSLAHVLLGCLACVLIFLPGVEGVAQVFSKKVLGVEGLLQGILQTLGVLGAIAFSAYNIYKHPRNLQKNFTKNAIRDKCGFDLTGKTWVYSSFVKQQTQFFLGFLVVSFAFVQSNYSVAPYAWLLPLLLCILPGLYQLYFKPDANKVDCFRENMSRKTTTSVGPARMVTA